MRPELLAPAGSPEALRAAVQNGADAVYLGWGAFNARRGAKNFSDEEFAAALAYCHERGVRVFLTLNTLVTDRELPQALETAVQAGRLGVDAVLVQDWGLFGLLRRTLPDLPLHASTQMSLFTSGGARELAADACERVVIARECSAEDTRTICENCPVEVEVFAHGALCMCYSGQCGMSALIGGRSGNRGRCAQPCRLPYGVNAPAKKAYPLSLKDSCLAGRLEEMGAMGVSCVKLEGRMKRPEYVAVITRIYARLLEEGRGPTADERAELEQAFSRSGFTDWYWQGKHGAAMFGTRPENAPDPKDLFEEARRAYERDSLRTVPVDLSCSVSAGVPCTLTVSDRDGHSVTVTGPVPEAARTRALDGLELEARLRKTGGTAYRCDNVVTLVDEGLSLPASAVNALQVDTLLDSIKADDSGITFVGYASGFERQGAADAEKLEEAVALAKKADTVLLCLGLDELRESEGLDRADMKLAENQQQLLAAVAAVNPNVVVLLSAGAPVETPWAGQCRALVYGALGGQAGAGAAADILTGKLCPCGKLSQTWAQAHDDTPAKANFGGEGRNIEYREGLYVGYRYYQTAGVPVAFPFGYGLSYTTFEYSDLKADEKGVTLTVTNTGSCAGAEIVQLYVAKPDAKIFRPAQELKGFAKVSLAPGESRTVSIALDDKAFRYWNVKTDRWEVEGGSYQLRVGASSADIRLTAEVSVKGTNAPDPYEGLDLFHYVSGQITYVTDAEFEALLGRPVPEDVVRIDRNMTLGEMDHGRSPLGWVAQKVLRCRLDSSFAKGTPDLNTVFQYNMPLRALAKMTNGMVSMGMVDGLVWELKGFWLVGILRVIYEFVKNLILNSQMENRLKNS